MKIYCSSPFKVFEILKRTKSKAKYSMGKFASLFTTSLSAHFTLFSLLCTFHGLFVDCKMSEQVVWTRVKVIRTRLCGELVCVTFSQADLKHWGPSIDRPIRQWQENQDLPKDDVVTLVSSRQVLGCQVLGVSSRPSVKQFGWQSAPPSSCFLAGKLSGLVGSLFLKSLDLVKRKWKIEHEIDSVDRSSVCSEAVIELFGQGEEGVETKLLSPISPLVMTKRTRHLHTHKDTSCWNEFPRSVGSVWPWSQDEESSRCSSRSRRSS